MLHIPLDEYYVFTNTYVYEIWIHQGYWPDFIITITITKSDRKKTAFNILLLIIYILNIYFVKRNIYFTKSSSVWRIIFLAILASLWLNFENWHIVYCKMWNFVGCLCKSICAAKNIAYAENIQIFQPHIFCTLGHGHICKRQHNGANNSSPKQDICIMRKKFICIKK